MAANRAHELPIVTENAEFRRQVQMFDKLDALRPLVVSAALALDLLNIGSAPGFEAHQ